MIRAGVGLSTLGESSHAARDAAGRAIDSLEGERADWCLAFASPEHADHLDAMLAALSDAMGTPYIVGCSASGILAEGREVEEGPALGVLAVASDKVRATPFIFGDNGDHGLTAGIRLGQRLVGSRGSHDLVLVWPDPFTVRPDRLLQGLNATLGGVPVAGGAASSRGAARSTFQFCGTEHLSAAVSGVRLEGELQHRVALTQGCRPLGEPLRVTRSHENLILEIEGRPALEVLREQAPSGLLDDPESALHLLFVGLVPDTPESIFRPGEYLVRNLIKADPDTGVIAIADTVEEGQYILFAMRGAHAAREDLVRMLARVAAEGLTLDYRFGLYFDCLARGRSLYGQDGVDAGLLARALPGVPLLGFSCNAEIAPLRGVNHLFTYSGVLVLVAD